MSLIYNKTTVTTLFLVATITASCQSKTAYYFNGDEVKSGGQVDLSGARWYHLGHKTYSIDDLKRFSTLNKISMRLPKGEKLKKVAPYHYVSKSKAIFVSARASHNYHTYFTRKYKHSVHIFQIEDVDVATFIVYKNNPLYARDKNQVYYMHTVLHDADQGSFRVYKSEKRKYYGADKNSVYIADKRVRNSDGASFQFLNKLYAKDKNNVYYVQHYSSSGPGTMVDDADAPSFKTITLGKYNTKKYARDKISAYYVGKKIPESHGASFQVIKLLAVVSTRVIKIMPTGTPKPYLVLTSNHFVYYLTVTRKIIKQSIL